MNTQQRKKSNFSKAYWVFSPEQQRSMDILYAYCREIDDIVDETTDKQLAQEQLTLWRSFLQGKRQAIGCLQADVELLLNQCDYLYAKDLLWILDGMQMDLEKNRYYNETDLLNYCDAVASAVGICFLAIMNLDPAKHKAYALTTGRALQLTNIMRDIKEDAQRDRVYIPQNILHKSQYSEQALLSAKYTESFHKMMIRMDKWAREEYEKSYAYAFANKQEEAKSLAAQIMRKVYQMLLNKMRRKKYKVLDSTVKLNALEKIYVLIWSASRYLYYKY